MKSIILFVTACLLIQTTVSKRGLLFPWDSKPEDLSNHWNRRNCPKPSMYMNWEAWKPPGIDGAFEFIAMARTKNDMKKLEEHMPHNGAKKLAFLNEPDMPGDTALNAAAAADLWRQIAVPYMKKGVHLLSPAITSNLAWGIPWMDDFLNRVKDVRPHAMAIHYYGNDPKHFKDYVNMVHNKYKMDLWITEVASTEKDMGRALNFLKDIVPWAEGQHFVKGVFWFCASRNANGNMNLPGSALMTPQGTKTPLGEHYCHR